MAGMLDIKDLIISRKKAGIKNQRTKSISMNFLELAKTKLCLAEIILDYAQADVGLFGIRARGLKIERMQRPSLRGRACVDELRS